VRKVFRKREVERRTLNALSVFVFGLGVFLFLLGPCTGLYSLGHAFIALVGTLVVGHSLRTYLKGFVNDDSERHHR
jgi:hypothetical protein